MYKCNRGMYVYLYIHNRNILHNLNKHLQKYFVLCYSKNKCVQNYAISENTVCTVIPHPTHRLEVVIISCWEKCAAKNLY